MKSIVIILAGGKGSRLSAVNEKQFIKVNGYTILEHTLKKFLNVYKKKSILIVIPYSKISKKRLSLYNKYTEHDFIIGGLTRKQSVKNSLEYIKTLNKIPDNILIHDAARPNVSIKLLNKNGCSIVAQPKGSINDKKIISFSIDNKISLYFIKHRLFKH